MDSILELVQGGGPDLQGRLRRRPQPVPHPLLQGAAVLRRHRLRPGLASCAAPTPPPAPSSPAAPPAARPRWSSSTSTTPTSRSSSRPRRARRTRSARCATPASTWTSAARTSLSVQYQNANNSVRVTDEFMRAVEDGGEFGLRARHRPARSSRPSTPRTLFRKIAQAAWECADPGIQYDDTINDWHTNPETGRITASNPCSEYMHLDNSSCNLASLNLHEVPQRRRHVRRRELRQGRRARHHRDGHLDLLRRLPDRDDRRDHPRLPPARHRLRQPRRAADGHRPRLRLRRRPGARRGDHLADDRHRLPALGRAGRRRRRRTTATPATPTPHKRVMRKHAAANDAIRPVGADDADVLKAATRPVAGRASSIGEKNGWRNAQASRARPDRHHRPHDGLRHHRHRAGPRAGQVQEAGRRRLDADRQPDGAAGAAQPGLPGGAGRGDRRVHRRARPRRRRAGPASPSTTRCSTAPWASGRSPRWATCG